jgi:hypothetical protein
LESESIALFRQVGDRLGLARALVVAGHHGGDFGRILPEGVKRQSVTLEEALALARELDDHFVAGWALARLGGWERHEGDPQRGKALIEKSWAEALASGSPWLLGSCSLDLGEVARAEGRHAAAREHFAASLPYFREASHTLGSIRALTQLAAVEARLGERRAARGHLSESLALAQKLGSTYAIGAGLATAANLAELAGDHSRAARWFGAARAVNPELLESLEPAERADCRADLAAARASLGEADFERLLAEGAALSREAAILEVTNDTNSA